MLQKLAYTGKQVNYFSFLLQKRAKYEWKKIPLGDAEIPAGEEEAGPEVLFGHLSWR